MDEAKRGGPIERFEDVIAWQKTRHLTRLVYRLTKSEDLARDYGLAGQLQRAAASIMSTIAEGFARPGAAEFHRFLSTAKASCGETRSLLSVVLAAECVDRPTVHQLLARTNGLFPHRRRPPHLRRTPAEPSTSLPEKPVAPSTQHSSCYPAVTVAP